MLNISNWKSRYSRERARGLPLLGPRENCVSSHMVKNSSITGQNTYEYIKAQVGSIWERYVLYALLKKLAVLLRLLKKCSANANKTQLLLFKWLMNKICR